jgi:hypothetical protein
VTVKNKDIRVTARLPLMGSISVTPKEDLNHLSAQIGAASYLVPPAQGIEGATPTSPTGGAQGATPPADGGTSVTPTTSATITGVR